jgi:hypothetical protein
MSIDATVLSHIAGKFTTQTENLATEALVFILQRSVAARIAIREMAQRSGCDCSDDLTFETQVSNDDGSRPDVLGKLPDGNVRLVIEAKFWAGLTESQPVSYLQKSLPQTGGMLLFVAPEKRLYTLWLELTRRVVAAGYSLEQPGLPGLNKCCVRVGLHVLALVSWRLLLDTLISRVEQAGDLKSVADLKQLVGLCEQMDANAFLPLTSEEMTSTLGLRVMQFCDLANVLTEQLVFMGHGNVQGLRATGGYGCYSRYLRFKNYGAILQFSAWNWSKWSLSPLWLGVKGEDWKRSSKVRDALTRFSIEFREDDEHEYCFIPIHLTTGVEKEKVIADAFDQLIRVAEALPPPKSTLISEPSTSDLLQESNPTVKEV